MKPVKLVFSGINSFSERTEIDFSRLCAGGVFGIFGDTGSGKSTILDCINFALYSDVDRSKKKTDIINYNCDQAEVEFEFDLLSDGVRKNYRVERSIKRKNGLGKAMLYVSDGGDWQCIADNTSSVNAKIEEILGLSADDFRKCIALPQGEFAQFVKCATSDRLKLMERLFNLSRYGDKLKAAIAERDGQICTRYAELSGGFSAYEEYTEEARKVLCDKLAEDRKALAEAEKQLKLTEQAWRRDCALYEKKVEFDKIDKEIKEREEKSAVIIELKRKLGIYRECATVCETDAELTAARAKSEKAATDRVRYEQKIRELAEEERLLLKRTADENLVEKIEKAQAELAKLQASARDIGSKIEEEGKLGLLKSKFTTANLEADAIKDKLLYAQKAVAKAKSELEACPPLDLKTMLEKRLKPAILSGEYANELNYFAELRESIKGYDDKSNLYLFLREELTGRIRDLSLLLKSVSGGEIDVEMTISEVKERSARREELLRALSEKQKILTGLEGKNAVAEAKIESLKREGRECKQRLEKINARLKESFGEAEDCAAVIENLSKSIAEMKKRRAQDEQKIEELKARQEAGKLELVKLQTLQKSLAESVSSLTEKLKSEIAKSGLKTVEECAEIVKAVSAVPQAEEKIKKFEERGIALKNEFEKLSAIEGIAGISQEAAQASEGAYKKCAELVKTKSGEVILGENAVKNYSEKLSEKAQRKALLDKIKGEKELVEQLKELTRGNKFMEYIAGEYLSEIAVAASATLLSLTGGRYYLSYSDAFYVGDNYNGGNKRGVNTLSGGEIFLVSLSLALALSKEICRGSLKSIEFFFLDEGFGTLDESLIDTVMDALERLKSAEFVIGIISHVEELKHRIESKIIVNKATETQGSTIRVVG